MFHFFRYSLVDRLHKGSFEAQRHSITDAYDDGKEEAGWWGFHQCQPKEIEGCSHIHGILQDGERKRGHGRRAGEKAEVVTKTECGVETKLVEATPDENLSNDAAYIANYEYLVLT